MTTWRESVARRAKDARRGKRTSISDRDGKASVSVIVSTLNRRDYLQQTLLALREQTYKQFEVIVVNGPSRDGTDEMLRAFRGTARLASCGQASVGLSRNIGIELAAGDIVAFIDDDSPPETAWLEQLVARYRDPEVAAVGGAVFDIPLNEVIWTLCTCTRLGVPDTDSPGPLEKYLAVGADPVAYLPGCNMSFVRDVLCEVGGFNPLLRYCYEDVEVCARVIDRGHGINVIDDALVRHYRAPNATRDGQQRLTDPCPVLYSRAVFAMQCHRPPQRMEDVIDAIQRAATDFVRAVEAEPQAGASTPLEREALVERVKRAALDGLAAGRRPRPEVSFREADPASFRPYR